MTVDGDDIAPSPPVIHVAVLIVYYRGLDDITRCLASLRNADSPGLVVHMVIVDNEGSDALEELLSSTDDSVHAVRTPENLGFAGGNNFGWTYIEERLPETHYVVLLNQDTTVEPNWLAPLTDFMERHPEAGAAQAKILLMQEPELVNTVGNRCHYLGFGFVSGFRNRSDSFSALPSEISFASGCCVMLRASMLRNIGLFDDVMFMYCEDTDLGLRIRQSGMSNHVVPASVIYHDYTPSAPTKSYFWLERNRWLVVLAHYTLPTLLVLSPAFLLMECGQIVFSLRQSLFHDRLRVYAALLHPQMLRHVLRRRKQVRQLRRISQADLLEDLCGSIEASFVQSPLLKYVANPLLSAYWSIARRIIRW